MKTGSSRLLKILGTVFVPLDVISVSLFAVIGYGLVWVGSSGGKKRYYKTAAVMYFIDAVSAIVKLVVLRSLGTPGGSFADALFGKVPFVIFWTVTAAVMAVQGILSLRAAGECSDGGRFLE